MAGNGQSTQSAVNAMWYERSALSLLLLPLSLVYWLVSGLRRWAFRFGLLRSFPLGVPVIVVGNLSVGGTGKTPVTIWLVNALKARGFRPGVVSRGYRGNVGSAPLPVLPHSDPATVGDEPVLIAERCDCPVAVHPDRVAAGRLLLEQGVDVIVADDGLQHYRLQRDAELCVIDGQRVFGNGFLLPAGPLREPASRLRQVDVLLVNDHGDQPAALPDAGSAVRFRLVPGALQRIDGGAVLPLADLDGTRVHAVAAIGNPDRFFATLRHAGMEVIEHPRADHAALHSGDLEFDDDLPVVITEKDAVKCRQFGVEGVWVLPVDAEFDNAQWLDVLLDKNLALTSPTHV